MQDPIIMQIFDAQQYLVQTTFDHKCRHNFLIRAIISDYGVQVVFGVVEEQACLGYIILGF